MSANLTVIKRWCKYFDTYCLQQSAPWVNYWTHVFDFIKNTCSSNMLCLRCYNHLLQSSSTWIFYWLLSKGMGIRSLYSLFTVRCHHFITLNPSSSCVFIYNGELKQTQHLHSATLINSTIAFIAHNLYLPIARRAWGHKLLQRLINPRYS